MCRRGTEVSTLVSPLLGAGCAVARSGELQNGKETGLTNLGETLKLADLETLTPSCEELA
jgi:hypothetical protein